MMLTEEQIHRYSRHIILPEVGGRGQKRILEASVLLAGLGGAGSAAVLYLAAAGVGRIALWDPAPVTEADLTAAMAHTRAHLGLSRAASAAKAALAINPGVSVMLEESEDSAAEMLGPDWVVLLSAGPWRSLHDRAIRQGAKVVACGAHGAGGAVTLFQPGGPCLACSDADLLREARLYGEEAGESPVAAAAGVVGLMAAAEVIKVILGKGTGLVGRLLTYDGWEAAVDELPLKGRGGCPICGA